MIFRNIRHVSDIPLNLVSMEKLDDEDYLFLKVKANGISAKEILLLLKKRNTVPPT